MIFKNRKKILYLIIFVYCVSCNPIKPISNDVAFQSILEKCTSNDTSVVYKLDTILDFEWDRLIILDSYFDRKSIEKCIGSKIPNSILEDTEGPSEYLIVKEKEITKYVKSNFNVLPPKLILTFDRNGQSEKFPCGLENNGNAYIKLIKNPSLEWGGKTFLIFTK